jgi:3-hydroxy-3-methylglutaryl CoA synthase/uncharacterized OB-fold protein
MTLGITRFGAYVPRLRLRRAAVTSANAWMAPGLKSQGKGTRAFCSWDEDAVTMAVEAARDCLPPACRRGVNGLWLASTSFPYHDYQNGAVVAAALGLSGDIATLDLTGSQRAGIGGLGQALAGGHDGVLVVASERLRAKPASVQELTYGAGAAAFLLGSEGVVARMLGRASVSSQFADHVRSADTDYDYVWEERWVRDEGHAKLIPEVAAAALARAGITGEAVAHLVLPSPLKGAAEALAKRLGIGGAVADPLDEWCGYAGAAHGLLMLADVLSRAAPGQRILVIGFGQGVDALVLEVTEAILELPREGGIAACRDGGIVTDSYMRMLSFYGEVKPDWGMRGEKITNASLSAQFRVADRLAGFNAGACRACGTVQFPRLAYCVNPSCKAPAAQFDDHPLTEEHAKVVTYTADWLSYYPAPPLYVGFAQFDSGARLMMEMVDVGPEGLDIGTRLRMVFRIKERDRQRGFNRYFWKATPVANGERT